MCFLAGFHNGLPCVICIACRFDRFDVSVSWNGVERSLMGLRSYALAHRQGLEMYQAMTAAVAA